MRRIAVGMFVAVGLLASAHPAGSVPGDPDPTFGTNGVVATDLQSWGLGLDVALQADGSVVTVGGPSRLEVARYTPAGELDPGFGDAGHAVVPAGQYAAANAVAVDSQDRIVLGGSSQLGPIVVRLTADGERDDTFGDDGVLVLPGALVQRPSRIEDVVVDPDDRIVAVGRMGGGSGFEPGPSRGLVARIAADGTLDPTFSGDGIRPVGVFPRGQSLEAVDLAPDGRVVAVGEAPARSHRNGRTLVVLLLPGGGFDPSFHGDGVAAYDFLAGFEAALAVHVRADRRIVVGGRAGERVLLARVMPGGRLDPGFSGNGRLVTDLSPGNDAIRSVIEQPDGAVLVVGSAGARLLTGRLTTAGVPDPAFYGDGWRALDVAPGRDQGRAGVRQTDGGLVIAGYSAHDPAADGGDLVLLRVLTT